MKRTIVLAAGVGLTLASPVHAADVNLSASLVNSCVLSITTPGVMAAAPSGVRIGSEETDGVSAVMAVVSVGSRPTISFTAPTLTSSPTGWSGSPTLSIRYTSLSGVNQAYTSSASSALLGGLADTLTINGRIDNSQGFASGNYTLRTVATCSQ